MTADAPQPLSGLRVLDFTTNISGSFAALVLGDLGADVVKIERPPRGDDARLMAPIVFGTSTAFAALNRNKRSLSIDLKLPATREAVNALAAAADVLVENMRPGKMDELGFGFEAVSAINPRIVYCSISGFGQTGPLSSRPGYDAVIQGRTGIINITGEPDRPPSRVGPSIIDIGTGMWAGMAITSALAARQTCGKPQHLDVSLFDTGVAWMMLPIAQYALSGVAPQRMGGQSPLAAPADIYETNDEPIVVAVLNDTLWRRLCVALEAPELAEDPRFKVNANRVTNRVELTEALRALFRTRTRAEWLERLQAAEVPSDAVNGVPEILQDPQAIAHGAFVEFEHAELGRRVTGVTVPIKNSAFPGPRTFRPAPSLGQHSVEVLRELGLAEDAITEMVRTGAVQTPESGGRLAQDGAPAAAGAGRGQEEVR